LWQEQQWFDCKENVNGDSDGNRDGNGNGNSNSKGNGNGYGNSNSNGNSNSVGDGDGLIASAVLLHCPLLPTLHHTYLDFVSYNASAADKATCCHRCTTDSRRHGG
jgi:hypothetical protein